MNPLGQNPSYEQLLAENRRLKQQLEARQGIQLDLQRDEVTLRGVATSEVAIDNLQVSIPGVGKAVPQLVQVSNVTNQQGKMQLPSLASFEKFPIQVQAMQIRVPESTLNRVLSQRPVEGLSDLHLQVGDAGRLQLSGYAHKVFPIPFSVSGRVSAAGGSKLRFEVEKARVAGFLPVPRLMMNLFASLASREMAQMNVQQEGGAFVVDSRGFLPANVSVGIDSVQTRAGEVTLRKDPPA